MTPLIVDKSEWQRPGGADLDQYFPLTRRIKIDFFDGKRLGLCVGRHGSSLVQHGAFDLHHELLISPNERMTLRFE
jgi:hypothetical protein